MSNPFFIFFLFYCFSLPSHAARPLLIGVHIAETQSVEQYLHRLDLASSLGIKVIRIPVDWNVLEPTPCTFDTQYLLEVKKRIQGAQERGQRVVLLFSQSPPWANGGKEPSFPPTFQNYWSYAYALKRLYGKIISLDDQIDIRPETIMAVEVWNEPNSVEFWPTHGPREGAWVLVELEAAREYADLLSITYSVLKCQYPNLVVLGGSLASADTEYLDALYSRWGQISSFDALSLHPYTRVDERQGPHYSKAQYPDQCNSEDPLSPPWCFKSGIEAIHSLMSARGDGKKAIWITEFGTGSSDAWGDAGSEDEQKEHLRRALDILYNWAASDKGIDIPVAIIYRLVDDPTEDDFFGLLRQNYSMKPASYLLRSRLDQEGHLIGPYTRGYIISIQDTKWPGQADGLLEDLTKKAVYKGPYDKLIPYKIEVLREIIQSTSQRSYEPLYVD